jgi:hypothetical protein
MNKAKWEGYCRGEGSICCCFIYVVFFFACPPITILKVLIEFLIHSLALQLKFLMNDLFHIEKNYDYAVLIGPCLMSFFQLLGTRALLPWWLLLFLRIVTINPRYISCDNLQLKVPVCFQLSGLFLAGINSVLLLFLTHKMWDKLHSSLLHVQIFCQNPLVAAIVEVRMVY